MPKRKATRAGDKGRDDNAAANKKIKAAGDDNTAATNVKKKGLMDLQREMRDAVWIHALEDLRAAPEDKWDFFKTDFSTFISLLCVNEQVSYEVMGAFNSIAPHMTVYTDNVSQPTIEAAVTSTCKRRQSASFATTR